MKKGNKIAFQLFLVILIGGGAFAWYVWNKPARDVLDEKGIEITASALFDAYTKNENEANIKYLNKAIEVTGVVVEANENQAGQSVVMLQSSDPVFGINCTFKEDPGPLKKGATITFKGICTGFLSDVIINQGILVQQ